MLIRLLMVLALTSGCSEYESSTAVVNEEGRAITGPSIAVPGVSLVGIVGPVPQESPVADPAVAHLKAAIEAYQGIAARGGWEVVPPGQLLKIGAVNSSVAALRQRLLATEDLAELSAQSETFDLQLETALRRFQVRHGLQPDGVVSVQTLAALNVPVESRLATMSVNLSRLLAEKREWGLRYIEVNVAAASYRFVENGQSVLEALAIVGKPSWPTPRIDGIIDSLQFHPYWTVPPRIAAHEIWPKVKRDAGYLHRHHMRIVNGQIRQDPGPDNPLGKVKFIFPNPYSVYLHDTSNPELFARAERFLSHGCVRVSDALGLARALLRGDTAWPPARIDATLAQARNTRVLLAEPVAVHIVYDTAWVDKVGILQFREDVYGRDRADIAAPYHSRDEYGGPNVTSRPAGRP